MPFVFPPGSGRAQSKNKKDKKDKKTKILQKLLKKSVIFSKVFTTFDPYRFVFLHCKDTNPVLKYLVFVKKKHCKSFIKQKIYFVFMHTAKSLKDNKKNHHIVFSYNKKIYVLACILVLITNLLKQ
jgi:hypothetical protein